MIFLLKKEAECHSTTFAVSNSPTPPGTRFSSPSISISSWTDTTRPSDASASLLASGYRFLHPIRPSLIRFDFSESPSSCGRSPRSNILHVFVVGCLDVGARLFLGDGWMPGWWCQIEWPSDGRDRCRTVSEWAGLVCSLV